MSAIDEILGLARRAFRPAAALALALVLGAAAHAGTKSITIASTTSTDNSGLFAYLLPMFTSETGIEVRVIAVGTGQALRLAANGDADMLLVHHEVSERKFVAEGHGLERFAVMHNDFVVVGPAADPAGIRGMNDVAAALGRIAEGRFVFVSRGDESGTHKKELELWEASGANARPESGGWYREAGSGMGATLNTAQAMGGYTLCDRATWISFANRGDLDLLVEGDARLYNPYTAIVVNPARHPHVHAAEAQAFVDWLISETGQRAIADFRIDGQQLFYPDAVASAGDNDDER